MARGHTYASVGRELEPPVSRQAVRQTVDRDLVSRRIMETIASILDRQPAEVFPEASHLFDPKTLSHHRAA